MIKLYVSLIMMTSIFMKGQIMKIIKRLTIYNDYDNLTAEIIEALPTEQFDELPDGLVEFNDAYYEPAYTLGYRSYYPSEDDEVYYLVKES